MYKRFIRWASDRLDDDGIIGFITNRAYLETRQDDGFRQLAAQEFTDIYVLDLGSDVRRNPEDLRHHAQRLWYPDRRSHRVLCEGESQAGSACGIHYARREDAELAKDKLAYLGECRVGRH